MLASLPRPRITSAWLSSQRTWCGHPLLNRNRAKGGDRRAYMRAWRARNPGYMARKGREHRERRRLAALALVAATDNDAQ